jgi:hypothetical protein
MHSTGSWFHTCLYHFIYQFISYYIILYHIISFYIMFISFYISIYIILYHFISCLYHFISCLYHFIYHFISYYINLYHFIYHFISYYIILYHFISFYIIFYIIFYIYIPFYIIVWFYDSMIFYDSIITCCMLHLGVHLKLPTCRFPPLMSAAKGPSKPTQDHSEDQQHLRGSTFHSTMAWVSQYHELSQLSIKLIKPTLGPWEIELNL